MPLHKRKLVSAPKGITIMISHERSQILFSYELHTNEINLTFCHRSQQACREKQYIKRIKLIERGN